MITKRKLKKLIGEYGISNTMDIISELKYEALTKEDKDMIIKVKAIRKTMNLKKWGSN